VKRIRGGSGLGDSIYLRPIVDHFERAGERVQVCSAYPDVFLGTNAEVEPFARNNIDVLGHYVLGKGNPTTNQWQDVCASAGVSVRLGFDWPVRNQALVDRLRAQADGRPIIAIHGGRTPMDRTDGFGAELLPEREAFDAVLEALAGCFLVQIGRGERRYQLRAEVDLNGSTSVADLIDVARIADRLVAQCSFAIPLAEVFDKPLLVVWAASGMSEYRHPYIRQITPQKVLSKPTSRFVVDDWPIEKIGEAARAFRQL